MRQKTVLLASDTSACEALAQSLHREGFTVIPVADEREALSKFETNHIDLILLDVDLGHKLGWAAFKRLADRVPLVVIRARSPGPPAKSPFRASLQPLPEFGEPQCTHAPEPACNFPQTYYISRLSTARFHSNTLHSRTANS